MIREIFFTPSYLNREQTKKELEEFGVSIKNLGEGRDHAPLNSFITQSLVGTRIPGINVDLNSLTDYEKFLLHKNYSLSTIIDLDGVLVSPFHACTPNCRKTIGIDNLLWLRKVIKASEHTILWTSRIKVENEAKKYNNFPFLGKNMSGRLEKLGRGNLEVISNKSFSNKRSDVLLHMVQSEPGNDITYYIGSSYWDRKSVKEYASKALLPMRLVFFDTGHLIL